MPFCYKPLRLPHPLFTSWPTSYSAVLWLMTNLCTKSCKSVKPFKIYAPFCYWPVPFPCPLSERTNTNLYTHTQTLDLHAKFQPPRAKNCRHQRGGNFCGQTDRMTSRAAGCKSHETFCPQRSCCSSETNHLNDCSSKSSFELNGATSPTVCSPKPYWLFDGLFC